MPEKKLRVALVGVPMHEELEKRGGKEIKRSFFTPGVTKGIRAAVKQHLKKDIEELKRKGIKVEIYKDREYIAEGKKVESVEGLEVRPHPWIGGDVKDYVVPTEESMKKLSERIVEDLKDCDLVLCFGVGHQGAYPFYAFPGKVVRVDRHRDSALSILPKKRPKSMHSANYIDFVKKDLKRGRKIRFFGGSGLDKEFLRDVRKADMFDIDLDGLHDKYGMLSVYQPTSKGLLVSELGKAIQRTAPKRVLFFEYYPKRPHEKKRTEDIIKALSSHSLRVAAERSRKGVGKNS